jgi:hypothetical protein
METRADYLEAENVQQQELLSDIEVQFLNFIIEDAADQLQIINGGKTFVKDETDLIKHKLVAPSTKEKLELLKLGNDMSVPVYTCGTVFFTVLLLLSVQNYELSC